MDRVQCSNVTAHSHPSIFDYHRTFRYLLKLLHVIPQTTSDLHSHRLSMQQLRAVAMYLFIFFRQTR